MKRGNLKIEKNIDNPTLDLFDIVYHETGRFVMTRQDLKDLYSLIGELLPSLWREIPCKEHRYERACECGKPKEPKKEEGLCHCYNHFKHYPKLSTCTRCQ